MFSVYVLRSSKTGRRYVGSCAQLSDCLGRRKATKHGLPWILIHEDEFPTPRGSTARERYLKTGRGRDELDKLYR